MSATVYTSKLKCVLFMILRRGDSCRGVIYIRSRISTEVRLPTATHQQPRGFYFIRPTI
jgi:hypothetical protein